MIKDLGKDNVIFLIIWFIMAAVLAIAIVYDVLSASTVPAEAQCIENNTSFICVNPDGSYTIKEK